MTQQHTLTFSLRDWRQGSELLWRLGLSEDLRLTDSHELELEEDQLDELTWELEQSDLEFELEQLSE